MDYRKRGGRSPRRDYLARNDDSYSPIRRYRSRTRSRSPHQRLSPIEKRISLKRSRSRSRDRYPRREMNGSRRSRTPPERKSRVDTKPDYWGPEDPKALARAVLSPHRLVVVRKTGFDENNSQKQDSGERNRSHHDGTDYSRRNRHSPGRSRSSHGRDHSREKRNYDKDEEKKNRGGRDRRQREHRYQNGNRKKSEEQIDHKKPNNAEEETVENEESDQTITNEVPVPAGIPIRPFHYGPVVPMAPFPLPYRPPPPFLLPPRYPHPFIARPPFVHRLPPRPYPPNRFFPPVPPMY